jgi:hypothetical protein
MDPFRLLRFKSMRDRSDSDEAAGRQSSRWLAARLDDAAVERGGDRMETLRSEGVMTTAFTPSKSGWSCLAIK